MIEYVKGDLFASLPDRPLILPHVCNNLGVMGAGFVVPLARNYPNVAKAYHDMPSYPLGQSFFVEITKPARSLVANMIAQHGVIGMKNPKPIRYAALAGCMEQVSQVCRENPDKSYEIHAPRFGSGLAGGNWDFIEELIKEIWVPVAPVTIYSID